LEINNNIINDIIPNDNINLKGENKFKLPSPSINSDTNKENIINGDIPEINVPDIKLNQGSFKGNNNDLNINQENKLIDINMKENIMNKKFDINPSNIIKPKPFEIDIKEPNIKEGNIDFYLSGIIKGTNQGGNINMNDTNINLPNDNIKIDTNGQKFNTNLKGSNLNINGNMNGIDINDPSGNIKLKSKINSNIKGEIPNQKLNPPKIDINDKNIKWDFNLQGIIPGKPKKINNPSINLNSNGPQNISPELKINGNGNNIDINANNPKINFNVNSPKINIESPKIGINEDITGLKLDKNNALPSSEINLKGTSLNKGIDFGKIPGIDAPELEIKNPDIKNPNIKRLDKKASYFLSGIILGKKDIKYSNNLNGNLPKFDINPSKTDINGSKGNTNIKGPNINLNGIAPEINIKGSNINKPLDDINIKNSEFKKNINENIPNVEFNMKGGGVADSKINGNIGGNINLKEYNPSITGKIPGLNMESQNIEINGPNVNIKQSKATSNNDLLLQGEIPYKKENNINIPRVEISANGPIINSTKDINLMNNNNKIGLNEIINNDGMNNINIEMPKVDINNSNKFNLEDSIKGENLGGEINIIKNRPTNLKIKTDNDNKLGVNINIDEEMKKEDSEKNYISENNNNKVLYNSPRGGIGGMKKKGKGLPMVGSKNNNFKRSKISSIGQFDVDNVNVDNMKSANVGVNGQKIGDRINE